jgi:hypothetical protein
LRASCRASRGLSPGIGSIFLPCTSAHLTLYRGGPGPSRR